MVDKISALPISDSHAAQSSDGGSWPFETLSIQNLRAELHEHNGELSARTRTLLVIHLRKMMCEKDPETNTFLKDIFTSKGWNKQKLAELLTDDEVQDPNTRESTSLVRSATADYLPLFLRLDDSIQETLLQDLFYTKDKDGSVAIARLIQDEEDEILKRIFRYLARCPLTLTKPLDLESIFNKMDDQQLLKFAAVRGGQFQGPRFHEFTGLEKILTLSFDTVQQLITTLLSKSADSDGLWLYSWYRVQIQSDSARDALDDLVVTEQRKKFNGNFASPVGLLATLATQSMRDAWFPFGQFINRLTASELDTFISTNVLLWKPESEWDWRLCRVKLDQLRAINALIIHIIPQIKAPELQKILVEMQLEHEQYRYTWLKLFTTNGDQYIHTLVDFMRSNNINVVTFFFSLGISPNDSKKLETFTRPVFNLLNENERVQLLNSSSQWVPLVDAGSLSFDSNKAVLNTCVDGLRSRFYQAHPILNLNRSTKSPQQHINITGLAYLLLRYQYNRARNMNEHFRFLGFPTRSGYSRTDKLAVVEKLLLRIYGTNEERENAAAFTNYDRAVLNQGDLGDIARSFSQTINDLIDTKTSNSMDQEASAPMYPAINT